MSQIFTPGFGNERLRLQISDQDNERWEVLSMHQTIVMTDLQSGRRFTAQRAACGLNCYCDAELINWVDEPTTPPTTVGSN